MKHIRKKTKKIKYIDKDAERERLYRKSFKKVSKELDKLKGEYQTRMILTLFNRRVWRFLK
ncbi:hypothetical protein [Campylobacter mucosalis]|uniref:Uncharacterized protein n=1 Tax=Campylobacter mucosalis CCUG 21559 TaxID=1032067 RepID=A0A6G5QGY6_9BACT|nr:hypothetical protein [Campylobacter mucosalis]QCD44930.1 hypothetical protein CMUC_1156 [Campylobacter mucosalis CCUG 21559]